MACHSTLNKLTGKNGFTFKNSEDFVNKVKYLEVPPHRKMVTYAGSALFTSIPVDEAILVILGLLQKDISLSARCELSINQMITVLEFSLNTTYVVCDSVFYHQIRCATMGSPISLWVANLAMDDLEETPLDSAHTKPHGWYNYVNDTFIIL